MFRDRLRTTRNAADVRAGQRGWFSFEAKADIDETVIRIYDEISWFGITAADFVRELDRVSSAQIALHLDSPGGDVFDGIAIYNALRQHPARVNVTVDSIAASIASVIAMAGDTVTMAKGAMLMIHEPFALVIGDARDMRKQAEALDLMGDSLAGIYAQRAGGEVAEWRARMAEETWYSDQDAVDARLADKVSGDVATKNRFDLSIFRNFTPPSPAAPAESSEPVALQGDWRIRARHAAATAQLGMR